MTALIDRIRHVAFAGERCRGVAPGVTGLAAAVQQQYRRPAVAEHVSNKFVAGGAHKHCGGGSEASAHACRRVKVIAYMIGRSLHEPVRATCGPVTGLAICGKSPGCRSPLAVCARCAIEARRPSSGLRSYDKRLAS